jgi:hypothetical protein
MDEEKAERLSFGPFAALRVTPSFPAAPLPRFPAFYSHSSGALSSSARMIR